MDVARNEFIEKRILAKKRGKDFSVDLTKIVVSGSDLSTKTLLLSVTRK